MAVCPHCHRENPVISAYCPACGGEMNLQQESAQPDSPRPVFIPQPQLTLKWHKFLIFFSLPMGFISNLISLFTEVMPMLKNYSPSDWLPGLEQVMHTYLTSTAVMTVLLLVLALYTEWNLFRFQWRGVKSLLFTYGLNALYALFLMVLMFSSPANSHPETAHIVREFLVQFGGTFLGTILMFFLNRTYYRKRRGLFQPSEEEISL